MPFLQTPQLSSARVGGAIAITISSDISNYNLANDLTNNYDWDGVSPIEVAVTVNSGVYVYATSTATPAFTANLVTDSVLTINNNGTIVGYGGSGGAGGIWNGTQTGGSGGAGGNGISLSNVTCTINNESGGVIAGGGGGNGGNGSTRWNTNYDADSGCSAPTGNNGASGSAGYPNAYPVNNTTQGNPGSWGNAGSNGGTTAAGAFPPECPPTYYSGGSGGAAGKAINGTNTLNNSGNVYGATS